MFIYSFFFKKKSENFKSMNFICTVDLFSCFFYTNKLHFNLKVVITYVSAWGILELTCYCQKLTNSIVKKKLATTVYKVTNNAFLIT